MAGEATRWPRGHAVGVILQVRRQPSPDRSCQISDYAVVTRSGLSGTRWSRGHAVRVILRRPPHVRCSIDLRNGNW